MAKKPDNDKPGDKGPEWRAETAKKNMDAIQAFDVKQTWMEENGYKYNSSNGTWSK